MQIMTCSEITPHQVTALEAHAVEIDARLNASAINIQRTLLLEVIERIDISPTQLSLKLRRSALLPDNALSNVEAYQPDDAERDILTLNYPLQMKRRGVETKIILGGQAIGEPNPELIRLIATARHWYAGLNDGTYPTIANIAKVHNMDIGDVSRTLKLAFLATSVVTEIIRDQHPVDLTAEYLRRQSTNLPLDWNQQRTFFWVSSLTLHISYDASTIRPSVCWSESPRCETRSEMHLE